MAVILRRNISYAAPTLASLTVASRRRHHHLYGFLNVVHKAALAAC